MSDDRTAEGLRDEIALWLLDQARVMPWGSWELADGLLTGPLHALLTAAGERDALEATLARVTTLHYDDGSGWCPACEFGWPCQTRRALDGPA